MSSDSDKYVFQSAMEEHDATSLFQAKRWTYVVDSTSSGGVFNSQLQFDLNTLSSQNQWTDLSQGFIQFPVKLTISNAGTNDWTTLNAQSACIKNGFHNFIDSVQLVLGGSTVQTSQIYTNIDTSYKILTEWSQDELRKYGPTLGIALDDYQSTTDNTAVSSLDNVAIATLMPRYVGVDMSKATNPGLKERIKMLNTDTTSTTTNAAANVIIPNCFTVGKSNIQVDAAPTAAGDNLVAFYLATVRIPDISDVGAKLPPMKSIRGYLYVNYNSATSSFALPVSSSLPTSAITNSAQYGHCQPAMLSTVSLVNKDDGIINMTFKSEISGVKSTTLTNAVPPMTNARLYVPYYVASPEIDRMLTQKKVIRYNERFVGAFNMSKNSSVNLTLTPGIANPKRLILCPLMVGDNTTAPDASTGTITGQRDFPELSPFDTAGCGTTSPFAALTQLQVNVGNQPMFQEPVNFDHHMFLEEVAQVGLDGGLNTQDASGLLSQRLWNQLYRYYTVDIGRRINGDDGASKSVQLVATNATAANMRVIYSIWHEKEITVDTGMGVITQGF